MAYIGRRLPRGEDPSLLTGQGRYVSDLRLPGMAQLAIVRSLHAHAHPPHRCAAGAGAAGRDRRLHRRRPARDEESALVRQACPLLAEAAAAIGSPAIRTRGTIGGSLAYADPAAELPLALICLGGSVVVASPTNRHEIAAEDWLRAPGATAIALGELVVAARVPLPPAMAGMALEEISRGFGRPALVAAACLITLDAQGHIARAQLALCGAGASPRRLPNCEHALLGAAPTSELIAQVAQQATDAVTFASDVHASAELRRRIAAAATQRALGRAALTLPSPTGRGS